MTPGFASSDESDLIRAERDVQERIGDLPVDLGSLAAISNIFRASNKARYHLERTVLADQDLSFTAFTVLWVLWVWGEQEARHLAVEAGISKGTLTGVMTTLERRGYLERNSHPTDKRLVLVDATEAGAAVMATLFPRFNAEETRIASGLDAEEKRALASSLRTVLRTLEGLAD